LGHFCPAFSVNLTPALTTFKDFKTTEIIEYMHKEKAYKETEPNQLIPYSLAKHLNALK
jgi:hypothetical protein